MKKALFGLAFIGALVGGAVVLNMGEIPVSELRAARLSECPSEEDQAVDCPGGVKAQKNFCLCLTNLGAVPNEQKSVPANMRRRLVVCSVVDGESGQPSLQTRYEPMAAPLEQGCVLAVANILLPGISMHNVPSGIETALAARCKPCVITPDSWGHCPACLHPDYGKTCAEACPEVEDGM